MFAIASFEKAYTPQSVYAGESMEWVTGIPSLYSL